MCRFESQLSELELKMEEAHAELARWQTEPLSKASIGKMKFRKIAGCLSAFLTNYDGLHVDSCVR